MLTVEFNLTFLPGTEGDYFVVPYVEDDTGSNLFVNGPITIGSPRPAATSVTPNSGTVSNGVATVFTAEFSDGDGASDIQWALVTFYRGSFANSCTVLWFPGALLLWDDAAADFLFAGVPGVSGVASNSQCSLDAGASSQSVGGNDVTLDVAVTFNGSYAGNTGVLSLASDSVGIGNVLAAGTIEVQ